jgi:Carboxypeptidase regulatory-like domain
MAPSRWLFLTLVLLLVPIAAGAQGTVVGVVKDASEATLPGVTITAQSNVLRQKVETISDSQGEFKIANLPTGTYTFTFALPGFDIASLKNVAVGAGTTTVTAIAASDDGCGQFRRTESCLTFRQVAATVPEAFRPLWDSGLRDIGPVQSGLPCDSISLSRRAGLIFVAGYTYQLALYRDGRAELRSRDRPDRDTDYAGTVNVWDYGKLCYLAQHLGFDRLVQHYSASWTDSSGITITVVSKGRKIVVSEYAGIGPIELWALENAIESIKGRIDWKAK